MRSKAPKTGSPIHRPVQHITELRLEAVHGWTTNPPYDLTLLVIVFPGVLPELNGESDEPRNQREMTQETIVEVAQGMPLDGAPARDLLRFWESFGDALARHCKPSDTAPEAVREAVRSLSAEVLSEDDLSYARVLRSAEIDLDHLS